MEPGGSLQSGTVKRVNYDPPVAGRLFTKAECRARSERAITRWKARDGSIGKKRFTPDDPIQRGLYIKLRAVLGPGPARQAMGWL